MAKPWNGSRPRPAAAPVTPTTLTEITRRYHATAMALAKTLGLPMSAQFLHDYRESIACCYIEAGRAGVRLSGDVKLPPLTTPSAPPLPAASSAPVEQIHPSAPVTTTMAAPPASTNGHTPAPEAPKGAPKNLQQKSDLLREIQAELTRIGRPVGEVTSLYQAAFGDEMTTWALVCGESLHTLKHGLACLKTLNPEGSHANAAETLTPSTTPAAPAGEGLKSDPSPEAGAAGSSSAPAPEPEDTVESLVVFALSLGLEEQVTRRIIKLHRDLGKCRKIFIEAAARNKLKVA